MKILKKLDLHWDENAGSQGNPIIKRAADYQPETVINYFEFLEQFPPDPEELKRVGNYKYPFTLP